MDTWFDRINAYGAEIGVQIEHYIVSSGIKEIVEGAEIARFFKKIYAQSFYMTMMVRFYGLNLL